MMGRILIRLSALGVLLLGCGLLLGDDTQAPAKGRKSLPTGWSKLGLSADQKAQIRKIQAEYRVKIDDLQKQIDKLLQQQRADMRKVLTDAQRARLKEILANRAGLDTEEAETKAKANEKK